MCQMSQPPPSPPPPTAPSLPRAVFHIINVSFGLDDQM